MITRNKAKNVKKELIPESGFFSTVLGRFEDSFQAFLDELSLKCLLCTPLTENSAEVKKESGPEVAQAEPEVARVGPVEQEVKPKVEPGDKQRNNQGSSKRKLSQQDKKIQKRPSRVLARVSFVCIEYAASYILHIICSLLKSQSHLRNPI